MLTPTAMRQLTPEQLAYITCLVTVLIDMMGMHFMMPAMVPYMQSMGADVRMMGYVMTANMFCRVIGGLTMPRFADRTKLSWTVQLSMAGSAIAYLVSGLAQYAGAKSYGVYFGGRMLGGLFGGTLSLLMAYVAELSMPDTELLKARNSGLIGFSQVLFAYSPLPCLPPPSFVSS